ncbi:lipopolysaccharide biosynthesis protein [Aestuariimicrobium sp. T2.26MG-19.2B]|uniref:lipopolysaccharide biosynthesis protein n=1 Tax=Aestuariimicrobium sp. T2.26MG-19.2B TaxID=3040679 RepID=UPI002477A42F|nr:hypothetical protein [Aestuariimicrobium sp. T2.26MG-19.2B]CAI9406224.1 hypothetical protein AESSP_01582 [Aestuariimicrobium sp. T2.26MG-19.2B]
MFKALSARGLTTLTSAIFGILTARLILGHAGVEYFALYALVTVLPSLVQFQDLGTGAALVNTIATADAPDDDSHVADTLTSVWRIMLKFAVVLTALNVVLLVSGGWMWLLGEPGLLPRASLVVFTCLSVWAVAVPLGIWQRILLGLRKNHLTILIQGLMAPINFLLVWVLIGSGSGAFPFLSLASYVGAFVIATVGMAASVRHLGRAVGRACRQVFKPAHHPGVRVMDVGWPMMAQLLSAPLSITAQRYVLARSGTTGELAEYTASAQVYLAFLGMISAAGIALWPSYARRRAAGQLTSGPFLLSALLGAASLAVMVVVGLLRGPLFAFTTNGQVPVHLNTVMAFSVMIVIQACLYPLGMFIMDKPGIRFQALPTAAMAVMSLLLAIVVTPRLGVVGPILSNCLCVLVFQLVPFTLYIHRHRARLWQAA